MPCPLERLSSRLEADRRIGRAAAGLRAAGAAARSALRELGEELPAAPYQERQRHEAVRKGCEAVVAAVQEALAPPWLAALHGGPRPPAKPLRPRPEPGPKPETRARRNGSSKGG